MKPNIANAPNLVVDFDHEMFMVAQIEGERGEHNANDKIKN
jgi:hypothetical protein